MTAPLAEPTAADRRRWARYLVEERAEGRVYQRLADSRTGEERDILLRLADAERRHEQHWIDLLGGTPERLPRAGIRSRLLGWMAGRFGSIFVLALAQVAEISGGRAFTAEDSGALDEVYETLGSRIGTKSEKREVSAGFAAFGLLALAGAAFTSLRWRGRLP